MTDVAVYGARGYLGRTLVGILANHPSVDAIHPVSTTAAGRAYGDEVPSMGHLSHLSLVPPRDPAVAASDVALIATDAEVAAHAVADLKAGPDPPVVVDLSRAHRATALAGSDTWSYALPDLPAGLDPDSDNVANPGCYPTATLLALGPALAAGLAGPGPVVVDGKSGVSGAGATPRDDLHFPEANESLRAYGVEGHDHQDEIQAALAHLDADGTERPVRFTPHLVPQNRGLLVTAYLPLAPDVDPDHVDQVYAKAYREGSFVEVVDEPDTAHVRGSHRAQVAVTVDDEAGLLVARGATDNLVRGGAGTAVHNMNILLGLDPHAGLPKAGVTP